MTYSRKLTIGWSGFAPRKNAKRGQPFAGGLRDKVDTARVPRIASHEPRGGEPHAAHNAVLQHRLTRVLRARGIEAARARQRQREDDLIEPDRPGDDVAHHAGLPTRAIASATSAAKAAYGAAAAWGRRTRTTSAPAPAGGSAARAPRTRRRARLGTPAPPTAPETVIPTRGTAPPAAVPKAVRVASAARRPRRRTRENSAARRRL